MVSRKEIQEEKKLARVELTKILKAIMIDAYFYYMEVGVSQSQQQGTSVRKIVAQVSGSQSCCASNHIQFKIFTKKNHDGTNGIEKPNMTGKQLALFDKFVEKHKHNTKRLFKNHESIKLVLKRTPTAEEREWADAVFLEEGLSANYGSQIFNVKFNASVILSISRLLPSNLEESKAKILEEVSNYKNYQSSAILNFTDSPEIIATGYNDRYVYISACYALDDVGATEI